VEFQYLDGGNSEVQDMQAEAYLYASSGTTGIAATGVIEGLVVTQTSTASGSVLIAAGACVNQASLGQGASRLINPSQKTLDIFTANPVGGLPRNDIVVFDSVTKLISVIVGTPNATPTDPTVPATAVLLARLRNLASATTIPTAQIDNLIVATTLRGIPAPKVAVNAKLTTNSAGFYVANTGLLSAPSITGDGVKKFKITVNFQAITSTGASEVYNINIDDSTLGVILTNRQFIMPATAGSQIGACMTTVDTPAAGSHVYRLTGTRTAGAGIGTLPANANSPIEIIVEQIT